MKKRKTINENWNEYDKSVGRSQLSNYGIIFIDEYDSPIDNEFELEELNKKFLWEKGDIQIVKGER